DATALLLESLHDLVAVAGCVTELAQHRRADLPPPHPAAELERPSPSTSSHVFLRALPRPLATVMRSLAIASESSRYIATARIATPQSRRTLGRRCPVRPRVRSRPARAPIRGGAARSSTRCTPGRSRTPTPTGWVICPG